MKDTVSSCPECFESVQYDRFDYDAPLRCWHCNRSLRSVHECGGEWVDYECSDYLELTEDQ